MLILPGSIPVPLPLHLHTHTRTHTCTPQNFSSSLKANAWARHICDKVGGKMGGNEEFAQGTSDKDVAVTDAELLELAALFAKMQQ